MRGRFPEFLHLGQRAWKLRTDCVELSWRALDARTLLGGPSVRVTTLFNKLLNLQGLRVLGLEFVDDELFLSPGG